MRFTIGDTDYYFSVGPLMLVICIVDLIHWFNIYIISALTLWYYISGCVIVPCDHLKRVISIDLMDTANLYC